MTKLKETQVWKRRSESSMTMEFHLITPATCHYCQHIAEKGEEGYFRKDWERSGKLHLYYFCGKCFEHSDMTILPTIKEELVMVFVIDEPELDMEPVMITAPTTRPYKDDISVFQAATMNLEGEEVNDMTRLSGRPGATFDDSQLDSKKKRYLSNEIHDKSTVKDVMDKPIESLESFDTMLANLKNGKVALSDVDIELLEEKKEKENE